jgi:hypothetical protein
MSRKPPPNDDAQVASCVYDSHGRLAVVCDGREHVALEFDDEFRRTIRRCPGKIVDSVPGDRGYCAAPCPTWTFHRLAAERAAVYDVYIVSFQELGGRWQGDYGVSGGRLIPAADPAETWLGTGWHKLGSVALPAGTPELTLSYHGSQGAEAAAVMLVEKS